MSLIAFRRLPIGEVDMHLDPIPRFLDRGRALRTHRGTRLSSTLQVPNF